jgi:hypothetical protein
MENTKKTNKESENNNNNNIITPICNNLKINKINELKNTLRGILENFDNKNYSSI